MFKRGTGLLRGGPILVSALAATTLAVVLLTPSSAAAACPAGSYCTDENGKYELIVPPLPTTGILAPYRDCVWQVHVDFGDGTSQDYVFEGEVGLSGSHTFPGYGTYHVHIELSGGYHKSSPTHEACPNPTQEATVLYRDPVKVAEEEQKEKEEQAAREKKEQEEREKAASGETPSGSGKGSGGSQPGSGQQEESAGGRTGILLWRSCGKQVYAKRVACRKARKVVRGAQTKLGDGGSGRVAGFRCTVRPSQPRPVSCRRGAGEVLGPLP